MSNDVVPDWAITTSARLLKRGWRDGGRKKEDGGSGAEEMTEGTNAGNSTFIPYHLLNIISTPKFLF